METTPHRNYRRGVENAAIRVFDVVFAVTGALCLLPFILAIALAVKASSPGPVFFRQLRLGKEGRRFRIYKYRTMIDGAENVGMGVLTARNDDRITRVGRFLRSWSIDELPQLINVIKGEMSLVGPRPALLSHLQAYERRQSRRLLVRPGITGWAQVNGRNSLTWPERIELDLWYVDHRSLALNARIIARTIPVLFSRAGLYGPPKNFELSAPGSSASRTAPSRRPAG